MAEDGDAEAIQALNRQAMYLGKGLLIITAALAPDVILLTGGLTSSWARFGPMVEAELAGNMLAGQPPRITVTSDAELARLRGAAVLVLQRHSGYNRTQPTTANGESIRSRKDRTIRPPPPTHKTPRPHRSFKVNLLVYSKTNQKFPDAGAPLRRRIAAESYPLSLTSYFS